MSTEYYATKKILWRELKERALPAPLRWSTDPERAARDQTYVGSIAVGDDRVVVWTGDHYHLQGNDPNVAVFERFGSNVAVRVLRHLGRLYGCEFVSYYGLVLDLDGEGDEVEHDDEVLVAAAQRARKL